MPPFAQAFATIALGLITGSYLNVVVHRVPRGLSTVRPRSACPECGTAIRAIDNIPVLSYLVLRGRCRECGHPIGWRYPEPFPEFAAFAGWVSFYPGRVSCTVDGEAVRAQAGGFYGGWITDELTGPFKGEPGTAGW